MIVKISTTTVGSYFGTCGVIKARNGRVLWTGDTRPYGFTAAALSDAESHAKRMGWTVVNP